MFTDQEIAAIVQDYNRAGHTTLTRRWIELTMNKRLPSIETIR